MVDDPLVENEHMREAVARFGNNVAEIQKTVVGAKEAIAVRGQQTSEIAQLQQDKKTLTWWLDGLAAALCFIGCLAGGALLVRGMRKRKKEDARVRRIVDEVTLTSMSADTIQMMPPPAKEEPSALEKPGPIGEAMVA
jgi:hypothetical protein